jgi:Lar family restriction alleviation protein
VVNTPKETAMSDVEELWPCPFCGGAPEIIGPMEPDGHGNEGGYVVSCTKCDASSRVHFPSMDEPKPHLITAWNKRATPKPGLSQFWTWERVEEALIKARAQGAAEERERLADAALMVECPTREDEFITWVIASEWLRSNTGEG